MSKKLQQELSDVSVALAWHPEGVGLGTVFLSRMRPHAKFVEPSHAIQTAAVSSDGVVFNQKFWEALTFKQRVFLVAHETGHYALGHIGMSVQLGLARWVGNECIVIEGQEHNVMLLGIAEDVFLNENLLRSGVGEWIDSGVKLSSLADGAYMATLGLNLAQTGPYTGPLDSLAIYTWLQRHSDSRKSAARRAGGARAVAGCSPSGIPGMGGEGNEPAEGGAGPGERARALAAEARATVRAAAIGRGDGVLADMFSPVQPKLSWRDLLRSAASHASDSAEDRTERSFSRASRREYEDGLILPGYIGTEAYMAVCIDTSGSVDRQWVARAVAETMEICQVSSGLRVYVVAHTSKVEAAAWIREGGDYSAIAQACGRTGGTDCTAAYADIAAAGRRLPGGKFDVAIHFTDGEVSPWPDMPGARNWVGILGPGSHYPKPKNAKILEVAE
jgi:hypothetical protein